MTAPDPERGAWLRRQRELRGWGTTEMARRIIKAGRDHGDHDLPGVKGMLRNVERWEKGGTISDRYRLHYCAALGIDPGDFGQPDPRPRAVTAPPHTAALAVPALSMEIPMPDMADPLSPPSTTMTYRGRQAPGLGEFAAGQEVAVMAAAHESSEHAAERDPYGVGEITLDSLRAGVVRLSRQTDTGSPLGTFLDLRRVRDRIHLLLDRRLRLREQGDLYFLLGCVNGLMGMNACRLGYPDAAEELLRAGWAYASIIDHNPLRGMLRATLASLMYYRKRYSESRDLAADGLRYTPQGSWGADLHTWHAHAAAQLGDVDTAREAVRLSDDARYSDYDDDLLQIGGGFVVSKATLHAMAGAVLVDVSGAERDAAAKLEEAIGLYDAGPGDREEFWFAGKPLVGIDLAIVRLRSGALDAAVAALEPAFVLPPEQRISDITGRLADVRGELAAPVFRNAPQARALGDQIEVYSREADAVGLHSLTG